MTTSCRSCIRFALALSAEKLPAVVNVTLLEDTTPQQSSERNSAASRTMRFTARRDPGLIKPYGFAGAESLSQETRRVITSSGAGLGRAGSHFCEPQFKSLENRMPYRLILLLLGWCFFALAIAGVLLPLVPATPFALLAAACFSKSSKQAHRFLMSFRYIGPILAEWQSNRGLSYESKLRMGALIGCTILLGAIFRMTHIAHVMLIFAAGSMAMLTIFLIPRRSRRSCTNSITANLTDPDHAPMCLNAESIHN